MGLSTAQGHTVSLHMEQLYLPLELLEPIWTWHWPTVLSRWSVQPEVGPKKICEWTVCICHYDRQWQPGGLGRQLLWKASLWQETAILLSTHRQQNRKGDNERPWRARLTADEQNSDDPEALCSFTTCVFTGHHPHAEHWTRPQGHEDPPARPWPLPQRPDGLLGGKQNEFILA